MFGARKRGVGCRLIAHRDGHADIAVRTVIPDFRRVRLRRLFKVDDRGKRLIIDADKLGRVARLRLGFGDNERHVIADATDTIGHEQRTRGRKTLSGPPRSRA